MPTTIVMPQLGESVAEGIIGKWLKQEGDRVERDEPFVEVITDKVNAEIPSPVAGVLLKLTQPEGATVPVGDEIAIIGDEDADTATTAPAAAQGQQQSDGSNGAGAERGAGSAVAVATKPPATEQATQRDGRSERVRSSPLVRRLADEHGVNLEEVPGTGIGGRVSKNDILQFVAQRGGGTATAPTAAPAESRPPAPAEAPKRAGASEERIPISPIRKLIAERMTVSKTTIPHAVTIVEVDMTNAVRYRDGRKDEFRQREGVSLSFVAFVIKATVEALKEYPDVNSEWGGDHILRKNDINISVAVDAPDGLITPVIHSADQKSLAALSQDITDLAVRARSKKLTVHDMQGGTFTVNNTGALGSVWSMSIIPPPQCGILAAGAIVKRPVVIEQDGQDLFAVRHMMNLSFSFDHRILDGGYAAGFVESVKRKLEAWFPDFPLY